MFEVSIRGSFTARHHLRLPDGSWEPPHAHDWHVEVTFSGSRLNELGVLIDFVDVQRQLSAALAPLHDADLNRLEIFSAAGPSAESVAVFIAGKMAAGVPQDVRVECVAVEEAPGCVARYWPHRSAPARRSAD